MNGYDLTRNWYNFKFENISKVKSVHSDLYFYTVDLWNRLGQKKEFGLPTSVTMESLGIGSYNTYKKILQDLIDFGFLKLIKESKNQYQSKIVALSKIDKALDKALDKAHNKALDKATDSIDKQRTKNKEIDSSESKIDFDSFLIFFNKCFGKKARVYPKGVKEKYNLRLKEGFTKEDFKNTILNLKENTFAKENNYGYVTLEYISKPKTLEMFSHIPSVQNNVVHTNIELN